MPHNRPHPLPPAHDKTPSTQQRVFLHQYHQQPPTPRSLSSNQTETSPSARSNVAVVVKPSPENACHQKMAASPANGIVTALSAPRATTASTRQSFMSSTISPTVANATIMKITPSVKRAALESRANVWKHPTVIPTSCAIIWNASHAHIAKCPSQMCTTARPTDEPSVQHMHTPQTPNLKNDEHASWWFDLIYYSSYNF